MKKLTHSVDAFVEVELIKSDGAAVNGHNTYDCMNRTSVQVKVRVKVRAVEIEEWRRGKVCHLTSDSFVSVTYSSLIDN